MQEPDNPMILEKIKDVLSMMDIKPSTKNTLLVYNMLLIGWKSDIFLQLS